MKLAALIPAYDCGRTVGRVVRRTKSVVPDVLVVDDGSLDHTAKFAESGGAEVVKHDVNRGKGAALVTGLRRLATKGFTHALTLDGDGQHLASEIPPLVAEAEAHPKAIVVGARKSNAGASAIKRFGNDFANLWVWIASGIEIPDTQSGFRVYPIAKTLGLGATGRRFDFETEILLRA
ncbi:MAG: glycosyltransferase family 2 protein, partial [Candidatus Binatia bacterium]